MIENMAEFGTEEDDGKILKNFNIEEEKFDHYLELFSQWISSQKHLQQDFSKFVVLNCVIYIFF